MPLKTPAENPPAEPTERAPTVEPSVDSSRGRRKKSTRRAVSAADPAAAHRVAKEPPLAVCGGINSGVQRKSTKDGVARQPRKSPKESKDDKKGNNEEQKKTSQEKPPAESSSDAAKDFGKVDDSPAETAPEEAAQRAAIAQRVPSVIRELSEEMELQVLLRGGSAGGRATESGGSGGSQRPARMVMVCFSAYWCRPCQVFAPKLEELARRYHRVAFVKLNVDKMPDVSDQYKVRTVPTFLLFRNGTQIGSVTAASQVKLEELLVSNGAVPLGDAELILMTQQLSTTAQPTNVMLTAAKKLGNN